MSEVVESDSGQSGLRKELGRLDTVLMLIAAIVVMDTLGAVSVGGAQAFTWLGVAALLFFVPSALVISELGAAFPAEGGPYVWTRLAFGRTIGSLTAFLYWVEAPVWLGGSLTITAVTVFSQFFAPLEGGWHYLAALVFIWVAIALAIVPLRRGKHVPASGAIVQVALLSFFTVSVVIYAVRNGIHGVSPGDFSPTWGVFVLVVPVLIYNLVGFEIPSSAAAEMRDPQRDVPASIARAGLWTVLLYAIPLLSILLVLPTERITSLGGFIDAMKSVFTVYGGHAGTDSAVVLTGAGKLLGGVAAAGFIWILLANGLTWIMGASRTQAIACLDGAGPRVLGRFSRREGTPVAVCLVSGAVATAVMIAGFGIAGSNGEKYFRVVLTLSIALIALANLAIFPALVRLRSTRPEVERPFRVPFGAPGAWGCSVLSTLWVGLALAAVLWPGIGLDSSNAALPAGFEHNRLGFELTVFAGLLLLVLAWGVLQATGRRGLDHSRAGPNLQPLKESRCK